MGTPATALSHILSTVMLWFGALWLLALLIGRVYAFHEAYMRIRQELANDARLLQLCGDAEFVAMMQQHADVCANVQVAAEINPWLKALNVALASPTLCGRDACVDLLARLFSWSGWSGVMFSVALACCAPQLVHWAFRPLLWPAQRDATPKTTYHYPVNAYGV